MNARPEELRAIVHNIWRSLLGLEAQDLEQPRVREPGESGMTGCVHVTGDWEGSVVLACPMRLVQRAAAAMFDLPVPDVGAEEMQDAMAELTNIAAGNIKSLLGGNSQASLPTLVDGKDYRLIVLDSHPLVELAFESEATGFELRLFEKNPS